VLFFIHLESRRVDIAGITVHPDERWMQQIARNVTMEGCGALRDCRYLLHDRDAKYTQSFRAIIASGLVEPFRLPACSPNLNAYAERWVRSVKEECLCKVILFGERSLRRALSEYVEHFHAERNHQGKGNVLLFPRSANTRRVGHILRLPGVGFDRQCLVPDVLHLSTSNAEPPATNVQVFSQSIIDPRAITALPPQAKEQPQAPTRVEPRTTSRVSMI